LPVPDARTTDVCHEGGPGDGPNRGRVAEAIRCAARAVSRVSGSVFPPARTGEHRLLRLTSRV
jgi:hypothetical protein